MSTAERVRLPDDCTVGYIVEGLLGARLLHSSLFHSHLESLQRLPPDTLLQQVGALGPCCLRRCPCPHLAPQLPDGLPAEQGLRAGVGPALRQLCRGPWTLAAVAQGPGCRGLPGSYGGSFVKNSCCAFPGGWAQGTRAMGSGSGVTGATDLAQGGGISFGQGVGDLSPLHMHQPPP